ncbi:MAG: peptidyl-prolyl cis-trans isomerase [Gammaproteobacteria bacterium]|nr:peptidyl-prolyl cis-trans isomerase [Gammaproteobacteria bacterium]
MSANRLRTCLVLGLLLCAGRVYAGDAPRVLLETNRGDITVELDQAKAPRSVANFLDYVSAGFYDGTIFHRVIPGFMIQGGGFTSDMIRKPTRDPIENEADNGRLNKRGTLAMARTQDPHSATAQFFINLVDNDFLDHQGKTPRGWGYAVFGDVVDGMNVVDDIAAVETGRVEGMADVPLEPIVIEHARVLEPAP